MRGFSVNTVCTLNKKGKKKKKTTRSYSLGTERITKPLRYIIIHIWVREVQIYRYIHRYGRRAGSPGKMKHIIINIYTKSGKENIYAPRPYSMYGT